MKKRLAAFLAAALMLFTLMPVTAFAEEPPVEGLEVVEAGALDTEEVVPEEDLATPQEETPAEPQEEEAPATPDAGPNSKIELSAPVQWIYASTDGGNSNSTTLTLTSDFDVDSDITFEMFKPGTEDPSTGVVTLSPSSGQVDAQGGLTVTVEAASATEASVDIRAKDTLTGLVKSNTVNLTVYPVAEITEITAPNAITDKKTGTDEAAIKTILGNTLPAKAGASNNTTITNVVWQCDSGYSPTATTTQYFSIASCDTPAGYQFGAGVTAAVKVAVTLQPVIITNVVQPDVINVPFGGDNTKFDLANKPTSVAGMTENGKKTNLVPIMANWTWDAGKVYDPTTAGTYKATTLVGSNDPTGYKYAPGIKDTVVTFVIVVGQAPTVTNVTLDSSVLSVYAGENIVVGSRITATVLPANAADPSLTWSSSNPDVLAYDKDTDIFTAKKAGEANIIATSVNYKTASCRVIVSKNVITGITNSVSPQDVLYGTTAETVAKKLNALLTGSPSNSVAVTFANGNTGRVAVTGWTCANYAPNTPDTYQFTPVLALGDSYELGGGVTVPTTAVTVLAQKTVTAITAPTSSPYTVPYGTAIEDFTSNGVPGTLTGTIDTTPGQTIQDVTWKEKVAGSYNPAKADATGVAFVAVIPSGYTLSGTPVIPEILVQVAKYEIDAFDEKAADLDKTVPVGTPEADLLASLPTKLTATVKDSEGKTVLYTFEVPVTWEKVAGNVATDGATAKYAVKNQSPTMDNAKVVGGWFNVTFTAQAKREIVEFGPLSPGADKVFAKVGEKDEKDLALPSTLAVSVTGSDGVSVTAGTLKVKVDYNWVPSPAYDKATAGEYVFTAVLTNLNTTKPATLATPKVTVTIGSPIESLTLSKTKAVVSVGTGLRLTATAAPQFCKDNTVSWSSSDSKIADVNNEGFVLGIAKGKAIITATSNEDNNIKATCEVTVGDTVKSVSLDAATKSVYAGDSFTLNATVKPETAEDKTVTWSSSDPAVAAVDANGKVTAAKVGTANITAVTNDGEYDAVCVVTVYPHVTNVALKSALAMKAGASTKLVASVLPANAMNKNVTWTSDKPAVASVDASGNVKAVANGTAKITAKSVDGGKTATCTITVTTAVTGVKLDKTSIALVRGKTATAKLTATVAPATASNKTVTWKSSKTSVATVDASGNVKAVGNGSATITVTTKDGSKSASCTVKVTTAVNKVKLNKTKKTLKVGQKYQLKATVSPSDASVKTVTWKSTKKSVATVTSKGKVTAKKAGTTYIYAKTTDGGFKAKCKITVKK